MLSSWLENLKDITTQILYKIVNSQLKLTEIRPTCSSFALSFRPDVAKNFVANLDHSSHRRCPRSQHSGVDVTILIILRY
jgi:hypothetical protein